MTARSRPATAQEEAWAALASADGFNARPPGRAWNAYRRPTNPQPRATDSSNLKG